jgi:tRNA (mo5U34)-methyltransferase
MNDASSDSLRRKVESVPFWWHSIKLGDGVTTPGHKTPELLQTELKSLNLPALKGKSVLDIGAWDGFYSFEAERQGASRVVALDHYVWSMDIPAMMAYYANCKEKGIVPEQYDAVPQMWRPAELPGKRGFDLAREALGSKVTSVVTDFTTTDLDALGQFDVTLYLGVIYHMQDPLRCLKRVAQVTRELAVIESSAIVVPGFENRALWEFYPTNELNDDVSNWWGPSRTGLLGMCRAAGFSRVEALTPEPRPSAGAALGAALHVASRKPIIYRIVVQAWK